ncbi:hypothetical protein D9M72_608130 [compost metagenome]
MSMSAMAGSSCILAQASSAVFLSGQTSQEKTTASPSSRFTAMGKLVSLPSGTSTPQFSIWAVAP